MSRRVLVNYSRVAHILFTDSIIIITVSELCISFKYRSTISFAIRLVPVRGFDIKITKLKPGKVLRNPKR